MKELKTFKDCLEVVKPGWLDYDGITIRVLHKKDKVDRLPTKRQAHQIINLKKMMVIAEAVGMRSYWIWPIVGTFEVDGYLSDPDLDNEETERFIRICQDPDGDGDESKNLFNPFKP